MPLLGPRRLPKRFRRRVGRMTLAVARTTTRSHDRRLQRRKERWVRLSRRVQQGLSVLIAEGRVWGVIAAVLTIVSIVGVLLFAPFFDVRTIRVRRQDPRINPDLVQHVLAPLFSERLVLVSRARVVALLQAALPDIQDVTIAKEYPSTLIVTITLDPVVAKARIVDDDTSIAASVSEDAMLSTATGGVETAYTYLTEDGIFVSSPISLSTAPLETIDLADWALRPQDGTLVIDPAVLDVIMTARDTLRRDFGLESKRIVYYLRSKEFHIQTQRATLWFDLRSDLGVHFERFRTFLKTVSFDDVREYIDLRIADRVVYR